MSTPCAQHHTGASASIHNQEYFNKEASNYDTKHEKTLNRLLEEIRGRLDFIGADWVEADDEDDDDQAVKKDERPQKSVRLLDYACGTGLVSRALAPYTTQCVGIDLSENMVATYNTRAENQGLAASEMHAYQGNLCVPDDPNPAAFASPEFFNFDVAAVGLGFHHFDDPSLAARRLAERLNTGGVLMIVDFMPHGTPDASHPAAHTITHHGFSKDHIRRIFEEAGVGRDFALEEMAVVFHIEKENGAVVRRNLFIARGTKA
ncbi:S-adenosyl-L-methionine-dependent methyltransferase [Parathielavia appendiculata]|uniref:S-adenosyl-L-methionine-dependent methyltransferase n=1 Tax=Parathielavia appendiculata TaxID=2587402 RepID=A0AAN6Z4A8_9PEZI|nr:S-adenosyl-L-methionine-dependent methyltransferase [Parathielavia appendiculata]